MKQKLTLILMTIVCAGPPLNLLFDYFALHKSLSFKMLFATMIAVLIYSIYLIWYFKNR